MTKREGPPRVILLTREDRYGVRDVEIALLNHSGEGLGELVASFRRAAPGARSLAEVDFNEAFAAWACSQGYCESVEWDEI